MDFYFNLTGRKLDHRISHPARILQIIKNQSSSKSSLFNLAWNGDCNLHIDNEKKRFCRELEFGIWDSTISSRI